MPPAAASRLRRGRLCGRGGEAGPVVPVRGSAVCGLSHTGYGQRLGGHWLSGPRPLRPYAATGGRMRCAGSADRSGFGSNSTSPAICKSLYPCRAIIRSRADGVFLRAGLPQGPRPYSLLGHGTMTPHLRSRSSARNPRPIYRLSLASWRVQAHSPLGGGPPAAGTATVRGTGLPARRAVRVLRRLSCRPSRPLPTAPSCSPPLTAPEGPRGGAEPPEARGGSLGRRGRAMAGTHRNREGPAQ